MTEDFIFFMIERKKKAKYNFKLSGGPWMSSSLIQMLYTVLWTRNYKRNGESPKTTWEMRKNKHFISQSMSSTIITASLREIIAVEFKLIMKKTNFPKSTTE